MSVTGEFFAAIGDRGGTDDRPFVDANAIAEQLGMNDTDLIAAIEALEFGNLIEEVRRGERYDVRLTESGLAQWRAR